MNVSLTPELAKFVHDKFKSGLYQTASEVVREALRLLEERDRLYQAGLGTCAGKSGRGSTSSTEVRGGPSTPTP